MSGAFAPIVTGLVDALRPIPEAFQDHSRFCVLIGNLGWEVDAETLNLSPLAPITADVKALLLTADALIADLGAKRTDATTFTADLIEVLSDLLVLVATLKDIDGSTVATELAEPALWVALALDLPEYLLLRYLEANTPVLYASLRFAGVIQVEHPDETTPTGELPIDRRRLVWENLVALIADPAGYVATRYHWDDAPTPFDHVSFLEDLWLLANGIGLRAELLSVRDTLASSFYDNRVPAEVRELVLPFYRAITGAGMVEIGMIVVPVPPSPGKDIDGVYVTNLTYSTGATSIDLGGGWTVTMSAKLEESGVTGVRVRPSGADLPAVLSAVQIELAIEGRPPEPWYLLGAPDGTFLRVHGVRHSIRFADDADGPELAVELGTLPGTDAETGVELAILPGEGDGFVHDLLGDMTLTAGMDLMGSWSSRDGLLIQGGGALLVTVPIQRSLGPVFLQSATIGIEMTEKGVSFEGALSASVTLGPFVLVLDRVGLTGKPLPPGDDGALVSFGDLALGLAFKPPSGVGISCNTGVVSGGGFLNIDPDIGQYAGVVDLQLLAVGLTAMGIISTQLPDGSDGWAMILSISSQFVPIQLGFGFTLNGVGGLVAVNRTLSASVLQEGLKDGSLDALLFPENPVAEAVRLLALLDTAFPIAEGQFTFGPIAEIGWGAPSLFTAQVGVIISLPDPLTIVVIGQFAAILPEPDRVLVEIHLDVLGVLDFAAGTVAVDAVLRDSFIVGLVLAGAMAFRSSFLTAPSFLLSCGGFHPDFQPPDNVPDLARLSVALDLGDALQVSLETYLAITSNTFQTGARLYAIAQAGKFTAEGEVGFNTLIYFRPFHFVADVGFAVEVRLGDMTLLGVDLTLTFTGPEPWHAVGTATFTFLGADIDFRVEGTLGGGSSAETIDAVDVSDELVAALQLAEAWAAPVLDVTEVTLRDTAAAGDTWAHPDGSIEVRQHLVPLAEVLDSYGNTPILGDNRFEITNATIGTIVATDTSDLSDWFAPAQFFTQTTAERLSSPSFELFKCGVAFGGGTARSGSEVASTLDYDCHYVDPEAEAEASHSVRELEAAELAMAVSTSLSAQATARRPTARRHVTPRVTVAPTRWVVARTDTLSVATSVLAAPGTHTNAQAALDAWLGSLPQDALTYQIIPEVEAL